MAGAAAERAGAAVEHGVYVGDAGSAPRKIASLGLRIRRGCSYHGLALNVGMDLAPFARINPCGYAGLVMCQLRDELAQDHPARALSDRELITAVDKACCLALSQHFPELDLGLDEQR